MWGTNPDKQVRSIFVPGQRLFSRDFTLTYIQMYMYIHVYTYIMVVWMVILRYLPSVSSSSCSWRVIDALYVRNTFAVNPSICSCRYLFSTVVCIYVIYTGDSDTGTVNHTENLFNDVLGHTS